MGVKHSGAPLRGPLRVPPTSAVCLQQECEPLASHVHARVKECCWQSGFLVSFPDTARIETYAITAAAFLMVTEQSCCVELVFAHPCCSERPGGRVRAAAPSPRILVLWCVCSVSRESCRDPCGSQSSGQMH